jgi:hypothetical protein
MGTVTEGLTFAQRYVNVRHNLAGNTARIERGQGVFEYFHYFFFTSLDTERPEGFPKRALARDKTFGTVRNISPYPSTL